MLLSLIAGVGRTVFAMADGDLPRALDAIHPTHRVPHRAELATGVAVLAVGIVADLRNAIGFSSFAVITYHVIANVSASTLSASERRWPRLVAVLGLAGSTLHALTLPSASVVTGAPSSPPSHSSGSSVP